LRGLRFYDAGFLFFNVFNCSFSVDWQFSLSGAFLKCFFFQLLRDFTLRGRGGYVYFDKNNSDDDSVHTAMRDAGFI
jgi:hypothetical protein